MKKTPNTVSGKPFGMMKIWVENIDLVKQMRNRDPKTFEPLEDLNVTLNRALKAYLKSSKVRKEIPPIVQ